MQANDSEQVSAQRTLATRLTPNIPAGIATLAVSGPDALRHIESLVDLQVASPQLNRIHYGHWAIRRQDGHTIGREQVVVCRTEVNTIEVHCHGGRAVCSAMLENLADCGCTIANLEDWPSGFGNSIAQAAEADLLLAATDRVAAILLDQLHGALDAELNKILRWIDTQQFEAAITALVQLHAWSRLGQKLTRPWRVVLAGPPNVGKSSLLNRLVGQAKSIVHAEAGTTRDWIESSAVIDGWPVLLTDTAGLRHTQDEIESEGVRRAHEQILAADLVVLTVDATQGYEPEHQSVIAQSDGRLLLLAYNKVDLLRSDSRLAESKERGFDSEWAAEVVQVSATNEPGVQSLADAIIRTLIPNYPVPGQAIPFRVEQGFQLRAALAGLLQGDAEDARTRLASLLHGTEEIWSQLD